MRTVATAGHVDHGKSSLVLALTGTDPDRFPEEHARGLTIDLGFAFCSLPSGARVGFVDVPGHVRFIKNMLAGVGAVDTALLVVAANEGWMPQTEEHACILELLGVRNGVVALTKQDLVEAASLEVTRREVRERLATTSLADAPVVVCDSRSGRGVPDVADALDAVLRGLAAPRDAGRPRLWLDRVFTVRGSGTVGTGTLAGGSVAIADELVVGPSRRPVRVRGIEVAGARADRAEPGSRVAVNLAGARVGDLHRGDAAVVAGQWAATTVVDVRLVPLADASPPRAGARMHAHVGSGEHAVRCRPLGDGRFARLHFDLALPLEPGDRIVLRDPGSQRTVAGAEVLDIAPVARAKDAPALLEQPPSTRLLAREAWLEPAELCRLGGLGAREADALVAEWVTDGAAAVVGRWITTPSELSRLRGRAVELVNAHHESAPLDAGIDIAVLATALGVTPEQLGAALAGDDELTLAHGVVRHATHADPLASPQVEAVLTAFAAAPFSPPRPLEVGASPQLVRELVRAGSLVELDGVVFSATALDQARSVVTEALQTRGALTIAEVRDLLGSSRRFVMPIVGWLDRVGVTVRDGDTRVAPAGTPTA